MRARDHDHNARREETNDEQGLTTRRAADIRAQHERQQRDRRREAGDHANPTADKTDARMVDAREELILAARAGERGGKLGVMHGSAECQNAAREPQHENGESRRERHGLKPETAEHAGADHVANNNGNGGNQGNAARGGGGRHGRGVNRHFRPPQLILTAGTAAAFPPQTAAP